jgi:hypothetical protein
MALNAAIVLEVRTGGADTNGGGFRTGAAGTDWSQQDAAQYAVTDGVTAGSTTITSATASFGTDVVGNLIYVAGGTGSVVGDWYEIISRTNATTIVVDRSTGLTAGTGVTLNIGGALASLGAAGQVAQVAGNKTWVKAGSYTVTSASTNVSGGCFSKSVRVYIEGYNATRGDLGTPPVLTASGISTFIFVTITGTRCSVANLSLDGASLTASQGIVLRGLGYRIKVANCTGGGFGSSTLGAVWIACEATGCTTTAPFASTVASAVYIDCVAYDNTITGFAGSGNASVFIRCIADSNSGATSDGFAPTGESCRLINCVAYGNGRDGIRITEQGTLTNCIAESNTGTGLNFTGANAQGPLAVNCATYDNGTATAGLASANAINIGPITGSGSFFTNAAGGDFSLNNTAGAGAACRATGFPGVLRYGGTGYLDVGALQHQDSGGGGTTLLFIPVE